MQNLAQGISDYQSELKVGLAAPLTHGGKERGLCRCFMGSLVLLSGEVPLMPICFCYEKEPENILTPTPCKLRSPPFCVEKDNRLALNPRSPIFWGILESRDLNIPQHYMSVASYVSKLHIFAQAFFQRTSPSDETTWQQKIF